MNPADSAPKKLVDPGDLAMIDQLAAELGEIVAAARRHMRTCPTVPAGVCIGEAATAQISMMCRAELGNLLQEAIAQLARAAGPAGDGG